MAGLNALPPKTPLSFAKIENQGFAAKDAGLPTKPQWSVQIEPPETVLKKWQTAEEKLARNYLKKAAKEKANSALAQLWTQYECKDAQLRDHMSAQLARSEAIFPTKEACDMAVAHTRELEDLKRWYANERGGLPPEASDEAVEDLRQNQKRDEELLRATHTLQQRGYGFDQQKLTLRNLFPNGITVSSVAHTQRQNEQEQGDLKKYQEKEWNAADIQGTDLQTLSELYARLTAEETALETILTARANAALAVERAHKAMRQKQEEADMATFRDDLRTEGFPIDAAQPTGSVKKPTPGAKPAIGPKPTLGQTPVPAPRPSKNRQQPEKYITWSKGDKGGWDRAGKQEGTPHSLEGIPLDMTRNNDLEALIIL